MIPITGGQQVTFGGWVYLESGGGGCIGWNASFYDANKNGIGPAVCLNPPTDSWVYQTATVTAPSNAAYVQLYVQVWQPGSNTVLRADDGFIQTAPVWSQTFAYDPFGNISKTGNPGNSFQPIYNSSNNRFSSIPGVTVSYDANGNVLYDGNHSYTWDASGSAINIDGFGLTYDVLGRMVEWNGSNTIEKVYLPTGQKLAIMSGQYVDFAFVPLPGGAVAEYHANGVFYYRHSDWLGSSRLVSTTTRTMYGDTAYAPFGEPYAQAGTSDLSFTGMNQDTVPGLYDFPAREYSIQGRWPTPDPAGLAAVDPTNPQSWNRYAYVGNNPLSYVDPLGLSDCPDLKSTCGDDWTDPCAGAPGVDLFGGGLGGAVCGGAQSNCDISLNPYLAVVGLKWLWVPLLLGLFGWLYAYSRIERRTEPHLPRPPDAS